MDDATQRPLAPRLLAAGMALPFLLALLAHMAGPTPAPVAAAPSRGALVFDQYLIDQGKALPTQEVIEAFNFTNRGKHPVEIQSLEPSCGCLRPRLGVLETKPASTNTPGSADDAAAVVRRRQEKKIYEPGEAGYFTIRVQTANQKPGQQEYTVKVKYKDPEPRETIVSFRVELPDEQVLVRPPALAVYQMGQASMETKGVQFEVTDRRKQHLNVEKVTCTCKGLEYRGIEIRATGSEVDEEGVWHERFEVKVPAKFPQGHTETTIAIYTNDPASQYNVLKLPLYLEGPDPRRMFDSQIQQTGGTALKSAKKKLKMPR